MSSKLNDLEFEVEDLVTGLSAHSGGNDAALSMKSKKHPYQKPFVIDIDLSENSQGKAIDTREFYSDGLLTTVGAS